MKCKEIQEKENVNLQLLNKKKVEKLKEKGITLISLVVTIIILLILVGVTVSQIVGENGLIQKVKEGAEKYKKAAEQEETQLGELDKYVSDLSIAEGNNGESESDDNSEAESLKSKIVKLENDLISLKSEVEKDKLDYEEFRDGFSIKGKDLYDFSFSGSGKIEIRFIWNDF